MPRPHDPVADFIKALRAGRNPSIDEAVARSAEQEREQLRNELICARRLYLASLSCVSDATLDRAAGRVKKAFQKASGAAALTAAVRALPRDLAHNANALLEYLVSAAGLVLRQQPDARIAQPVVQFRTRSSDVSPAVPKALQAARLKQVPDLAGRLLRDAAVEVPPVDLDVISSVAGVAVTQAELEDCDGCTFQFEQGPVVCLSTAVENHLRRRFTWAHELGHALLHRENPQWRDTTDMIERAWGLSSTEEEMEANLFASELLLPRVMLKADGVLAREFDFDLMGEIAERYQVSYTAATVRYVKTTDAAVAVFLVHGQQIIWGLRSDPYHVRLRRGRIHPESALLLEKRSEEYYSDAPEKAWIEGDGWGQVDEMGLPIGSGYWLIAVAPAEGDT